MKWPNLSVVIPNYNHGHCLPDCLNGIFQQSVAPLEVIVVDDGSTDHSVQVLEEFSRKHPTLRFLRNEKNQGALKAALRGLEQVKGDYIFLPSADDVVIPGFFEASLRLLAEHPQAAMSCTAAMWYDQKEELKWYMATGWADRPCYFSPDDMVKVGRRGKLPISTSSVIMRIKPMLECGGYFAELRWHADWYVTIVPALRYGLCYVPEVMSNVYLSSNSYYHRGRKSAQQREVLEFLMAKLSSPACADVKPRMRASAALSMFGFPLLRLMMRRPEYRWPLTPRFLWLTFRRIIEEFLIHFMPRSLARFCLRLFYGVKGRKKPDSPAAG